MERGDAKGGRPPTTEGHWTALARAAGLALALTGCKPSSPAAAPEQTQSRVLTIADGYKALAGAVTPFDMRGDPAEALRIASELEVQGIRQLLPDLVLAARVLEARAAGAGGNYARAVRVGTPLMQEPRLAAADRAFLQTAVYAWETSRVSAGDGTFTIFDDFWYLASYPKSPGRKPLDAPESVTRNAQVVLWAIAGHALTEAIMLGGPWSAEGNAALLQGYVVEDVANACGAKRPCAWGDLLTGRLMAAASRPEEALRLLSEAGSLASSSGDGVLVGVALIAQGDVVAAPRSSPLDLGFNLHRVGTTALEHNSGEPASALRPGDEAAFRAASSFYDQAMARFGAVHAERGVAQVVARRAYLAFARGDYGAAAEGFGAAASALAEHGDSLSARRCRLARLASLVAKGDYARARSEDDLVESDFVQSEALGHANASVNFWILIERWLLWERSDPRGALEAVQLARRVAERAGLLRALVSADEDNARVLSSLGRRHEAIESFLRAREELKNYSDRRKFPEDEHILWEATSLLAGAIGEMLFHEPAEMVLKYNDQLDALALKIKTAGVRQMLAAQVATTARALSPGAWDQQGPPYTAFAAIRRGQKELATNIGEAMIRKHWQQDAQFAQFIQSLEASGADTQLLQDQLSKNEWEQAIDLFLAAGAYTHAAKWWGRLETARPGWLFSDAMQPWQRMQRQAEIEGHTGNPQHAEQLYEGAIVRLEQFGGKIGSFRESSGFYDNTIELFRGLSDVMIAGSRNEEALATLERGRARTFQRQLRLAGLFAGDAKDESVFLQWSQAHAQRDALQENLARAMAKGNAVQEKELKVKSAALASTVEQLDAAMAARGTLDAPTDAASARKIVAGVASAMDPNVPTHLLVYSTIHDRVWAWVLDRGGVRALRRLPLSGMRLRELAPQFSRLVEHGLPDTAGVGKELYAALVAPVADTLQAPSQGPLKPRLGIVPSGALSRVAFAALPTPKGLLVQSFDTFYAPTLSAYAAAVQVASRQQRPLVVHAFGANLEGARVEARSVARGADPALDEGATIDAFRAAAQSPGILHLATHGNLDSQNPFYSSLNFSDGDLHGYDVLGMNVKSWLVALTACDTNVREVNASDDLTTVGGAFLASGVPTVIASSWRVRDDYTQKLMVTFYSELARGVPPVAALGNAQRIAVSQGVGAKVWAALSLMGMER